MRQQRGLACAVRAEQPQDASRASPGRSCATPRAGDRNGGRRPRRKLRRSRRSSRSDALAASLRSGVGVVELAVDLLELAKDAGAALGLRVGIAATGTTLRFDLRQLPEQRVAPGDQCLPCVLVCADWPLIASHAPSASSAARQRERDSSAASGYGTADPRA